MDSEDLLARIRLAVREFYANDSKLIELRTERPITHRVALYLELLFKGKDVDCNYNRYGDDPQKWVKKLQRMPECNDRRREREGDNLFYPDIVIHDRGSRDKHNLVVIEIKPYHDLDRCDKRKLELMTKTGDKYKYEFGVFLGFAVNNCNCILFENGQAHDPETIDPRA